MEDPSFHLGHAIHELNLVLNYIYLGLLLMCLILALGNRPHGSQWGYTIAMIGFAGITVYMMVWRRVLQPGCVLILCVCNCPGCSFLPRVQGNLQSSARPRLVDTLRSFHQLDLPEYRHINSGYDGPLLASIACLCEYSSVIDESVVLIVG